MNLSSRHRFMILAFICTIGALIAVGGMDWDGYVKTWIGAAFRASSGGAIGWAISRYVVRLDLSAIAAPDRTIAALSQAILMAGFAIAVAVGV